MTTVKTSATVRFSASGAVEVAPSIRLNASTFIHCHVYDDCAPILAIEDGNVRLSLTVPDTGHVTGQDVNRAHGAGRCGGPVHRRTRRARGRLKTAAEDAA